MTFTLPQLAIAHAAAAARAQQASTLYAAAERLNLPHSRGRDCKEDMG